jgi:ubiquinone/menaquinone biosynthesis C-methylase UbiE
MNVVDKELAGTHGDNKSELVNLVCPSCMELLRHTHNTLLCRCGISYAVIDGIPSFIAASEQEQVSFYEDWHKDPHKAYNLDGVGKPIRLSPFIERHRSFFEKVLNIPFKRERFFKRCTNMLRKATKNATVLDLGCGDGNPEILELGDIYGVDYSITAIKRGIAQKTYKMVVNCNAASLPFESERFDCIVSSDFIGHIPPGMKERLFSEMSRVMKKGGMCAHIIETDSDNFIKGFAKKYPDLYQRYFIDGIGGHFGLEMPAVVLRRFRTAGFEPVSVRKYYNYIWDMESFIALFDNEYKEKSFLLRGVLSFYRLLCKNFGVKVAATAVLGCLSFLVDALVPLSKAEGILVLCIKRH